MTQPRSTELASLPNLYLRDSRNRAFLEGKSDTIFPQVSRRLYGAGRRRCPIGGIRVFTTIRGRRSPAAALAPWSRSPTGMLVAQLCATQTAPGG
jgi:hypothetical protein